MITQPSIWGALSDSASNNVFWGLVNAGAPTNGTSGTGANLAGPGCLLIDITNKVLYQNTNTLASPTWTAIAGTGGGNVTVSGTQTLTNKTLTSPTINQPVTLVPTTTVAAAGSTQANGGSISLAGSGIVYCTTADGTVGLVMPVASAGMQIVIENASASILKVYGNTADTATINGTAGSTAYTIAANAAVMFTAPIAAIWKTIPKVSS